MCSVGAADSCQTFTLPRCRDVSHIPEVRGFLISGPLGFWVAHTDTQHTADVTGSADGSNGVAPRVPEGPSPCPGQWPGVSLSASKGGEEPAIADPCLPPWDAGSGHFRLPLAPVASPGESRAPACPGDAGYLPGAWQGGTSLPVVPSVWMPRSSGTFGLCLSLENPGAAASQAETQS